MAQKVLLIAADFPPNLGGVATYSLSLARSLKVGGWSVRVLTPFPDPDGLVQSDIPITRTSKWFNKKYLKVLPLLVNAFVICVKRCPDWLVLMKCSHEGIVGYLLRKLLGVKYIVVAYGGEILQFRNHLLLGRLMRAVIRSASGIVVDSTYTRSLLASLNVDHTRVFVIYPWLCRPGESEFSDVTDIRSRYGLDGKQVLLTVARLVKRKGHDQVIKSLRALKEKHPDIVYVIVGEGENKSALLEQCKQYGVGHMTRMLGSLPSESVDELYRACDIFVMPSRQEGTDVEGLGIAFLEAALRGKPVVGGNSGGVPDAVLDGQTGFLVDPLDDRELAKAIDVLLADGELRTRLGEKGRQRALQEFSLERTVERLREILGPPQRPADERIGRNAGPQAAGSGDCIGR